MADKPERPSLEIFEERDSNFNRIRIPTDLREQIMQDLAYNDSTESLPVPSDYDSDYPDPGVDIGGRDFAAEPAHSSAPAASDVASPAKGSKTAPGRSNLSSVIQSSDIPTPVAQRKEDPLAKEGERLKVPDGTGAETPERKGSGGNKNLNGHESDLTLTNSNIGSKLSQVPTQEDVEGKKRPGTMRRLTSKIKRTISSKG